ncbi:acyltransferase [Methylomicrobium sp. RS1]|uniref:acyltransferase n=1 Tax=Candidatus Methylomicrobium oryzae TaxID=2802053 RepID=UPI001921713B|nr:acyltransferase [Methylomicrobium sp. RS1]MBL1262365.1 acyltransferase [Methylomicrobium sp. RS1]
MEFKSPFRKKAFLSECLRQLLRASRKLMLKMLLQKKISWGRDFSIGKDFDIRPPLSAVFGNRVGIGKNITIECNVSVGDDVLISSNVAFVGNDHRFDDPTLTVYAQGRHPDATVVLEGDNLIGFGVILVGPVKVGRGCIVGAGSVVVKDLPPNSICAGVPAKFIRQRHASE